MTHQRRREPADTLYASIIVARKEWKENNSEKNSRATCVLVCWSEKEASRVHAPHRPRPKASHDADDGRTAKNTAVDTQSVVILTTFLILNYVTPLTHLVDTTYVAYQIFRRSSQLDFHPQTSWLAHARDLLRSHSLRAFSVPTDRGMTGSSFDELQCIVG